MSKQKLKKKTKKSMMTAVRLYGPVVAPRVRYCPKPGCGVMLEYWRSSRGYCWVCMKCHRVREFVK